MNIQNNGMDLEISPYSKNHLSFFLKKKQKI